MSKQTQVAQTLPTRPSAETHSARSGFAVSPYYLEDLYNRLGQPRWFWPVVQAALLILFVVGSSVAPDMGSF